MRRPREYTGEAFERPPAVTPEEKKKIEGMLRRGVEGIRRRRTHPSLIELYERELEKKKN